MNIPGVRATFYTEGNEPFIADIPAQTNLIPPEIPYSGGDYRITGSTRDGELFSFRFSMPELAHGDGRSVFAFTVPAQREWAGQLTEITLSGPGGTATLDDQHGRPMTIYRDLITGRVRGILRGQEIGLSGHSGRAAVPEWISRPGNEVYQSAGLPGISAWDR